ncbi:MAG: DNA-directed RNA polymerase subunit omega [Clostridia bacterium]
MLYPPINELTEKMQSRYMLVNVASRRARQIADVAEQEGVSLSEKPVRTAISEIESGRLKVNFKPE